MKQNELTKKNEKILIKMIEIQNKNPNK